MKTVNRTQETVSLTVDFNLKDIYLHLGLEVSELLLYIPVSIKIKAFKITFNVNPVVTKYKISGLSKNVFYITVLSHILATTD